MTDFPALGRLEHDGRVVGLSGDVMESIERTAAWIDGALQGFAWRAILDEGLDVADMGYTVGAGRYLTWRGHCIARAWLDFPPLDSDDYVVRARAEWYGLRGVTFTGVLR